MNLKMLNELLFETMSFYPVKEETNLHLSFIFSIQKARVLNTYVLYYAINKSPFTNFCVVVH